MKITTPRDDASPHSRTTAFMKATKEQGRFIIWKFDRLIAGRSSRIGIGTDPAIKIIFFEC